MRCMILTKDGRKVILIHETHVSAFKRAGWEVVEEQKPKQKPFKRATTRKAAPKTED